MNEKEICVSISLDRETLPVGKLYFHQHGNRQTASFSYDRRWLSHPERFAIDPALQLFSGSFHTTEQQQLFGAMGDSAPDRWGRVLMRRAEQARANHDGTTPRTLQESDYLLGVLDETRMGALRFSPTPNGPYLAEGNISAIPPLIELPKLLDATERYLDDEAGYEDLRLLLLPGSSLGGARPKATVMDHDGTLSLAKFPRKDDEFSQVLWEATALYLAAQAGIQTIDWRLETILGKSVLITRRFDRDHGKRIPFLSAMSMLSATDREQHSYLEIVYALTRYGAEPNEQLEELWRRMVFSILISNTDDHLRNHGFLYRKHRGWVLSPAYDINPVPLEMGARVHATAIGFDTPDSSIETALSCIDEFRISKFRAIEIVREIVKATTQWRQVAHRIGIDSRETDRMASAFEHTDLEVASRAAFA